MWLCARMCFHCKVISKPSHEPRASWTQDHLVFGSLWGNASALGAFSLSFSKYNNMDGSGVSSPWWTCSVSHEMENTNKFQKGSHGCWLGVVVSICSYFLFKISLLNKPVKQWTSSWVPHLLFVWLTSPLYLTVSPVPHPPSFCFQVSTEFQFKQTDLRIRRYDPHLRERVVFALGARVNLPSGVASVPFLSLQISFSFPLNKSPLCVRRIYSICSSLDGRPGWTRSLAIVSRAAMNKAEQE